MQLPKAGVILLAFTLVVMVNVEAKNLKPAKSYFTLCSRSDSKVLSECLEKSFMTMKPALVKGIARLGLAPLDPLIIPTVDLKDRSENVGLHFQGSNFTMQGMGAYTVDTVNAALNSEKFDLTLQFTVPEFHVTSDYEVRGQILVIPIHGVGTADISTGTMDFILTLKGHVVKRDNDDWIDMDDLKVTLDLKGKANIHFDNLFNGDKRLRDATNNFLNENHKEAFDAYKHMAEGALAEVFLDYAKKVFNAYPVNQLFLD